MKDLDLNKFLVSLSERRVKYGDRSEYSEVNCESLKSQVDEYDNLEEIKNYKTNIKKYPKF